MLQKIRITLEYNTYCIWLINENNEVIGNDNPPEWKDDEELTNAFMAVSDLYDTFFIDNKHEFKYVGCPDIQAADKLRSLFNTAMKILIRKNAGKYEIENDVNLNRIVDASKCGMRTDIKPFNNK